MQRFYCAKANKPKTLLLLWLYLLKSPHSLTPTAWQRCGTREQWDFNVCLSFLIERMALCDLGTLWSCQPNERLDGSSETLERSVGGIDFKHSESRQWPSWKSTTVRRWRETGQKKTGMDGRIVGREEEEVGETEEEGIKREKRKMKGQRERREWAGEVGQWLSEAKRAQRQVHDSLFCVVFWNITAFSPVVKNLK